MTVMGMNFEIWIYWVIHVGLVVGYGLFILTRKGD
jgi:hypothetical protein